MAKFRKSEFRPVMERIATLSEDRQKKIQTGASAIIEAMHLAEVRKALDVTQNDLAQATGLQQGEISRIENHTENVQLKTLEKYVLGLGGTFKIVADFPDGTHAEIPLRSGKPVKSRVKIETH
ncbi:helix-turn-helix domain-containing protein [Phyllobacterium sp. TAF24]|uniref:helix-turn-helix domain-containing protein n=1 Tax=Phyllobacterium sp. TAF24 TaxID=3233068 RepID=UPI003F9DB8C2